MGYEDDMEDYHDEKEFNKKKYAIITHIKLFLEKLIVFSTLIKS